MGKEEIIWSINFDDFTYRNKLFVNLTVLLSIILLPISIFSQTNQWQWAHRAGGIGAGPNGAPEEGRDIVVDSKGDVYVCGITYAFTSFDTFQVNVNYVDENIFLAKYTCEGELAWVKVFGSSRSDLVNGMTIDAADNVYIIGKIDKGQGQPAILGKDTLSSYGGLYISKFDPEGNNIWNKINFSTGSNALHIDKGPNGKLYLFGTAAPARTKLFSQFDIGGGSYGHYFLMKMDTSGSFDWLRYVSDTSISFKTGFTVNDMSVADNGDVYIGGYLQYDTLYFFSEVIVRKSNGTDIILAKMDSSGQPQWVRRAGGSGVNTANGIREYQGNIYVCGGISTAGITSVQDADFGNINVTKDVGMGSVPFLACYKPDGTTIWVETADNINGNGSAGSSSLDITKTGSIFWGGTYSGEMLFDSHVFEVTTSSGEPAYFVRSSIIGDFKEGISPSATGSQGTNFPNAIAGGYYNSMFYTGRFESRIVMQDLLDTINNTGGGDWDIIIAKYGNGDCSIPQDTSVNDSTIDTTGVSIATYTYNTLQISPNPVNSSNIELNLSEPIKESANIRIYNSGGLMIWEERVLAGETKIRPEVGISSGLYVIELKTKINTYSKKLIVIE